MMINTIILNLVSSPDPTFKEGKDLLTSSEEFGQIDDPWRNLYVLAHSLAVGMSKYHCLLYKLESPTQPYLTYQMLYLHITITVSVCVPHY